RGGSGDNRSDIFAFGCILYEMLAGAQAFRGESPIETLNAILKDDPPDFLELNVRVPGALDRVVRHCLEKNPDERFQSARDLAFALQSSLTSSSSASGSVAALAGSTSVGPAHRRRERVAWVAAAAFGVSTLALAAALSLRQ